RHTRCYRDWNSDVCSSDLQASQQLDRLDLALAPPGGRCAAPAPGRGDRAAAMLGKRTRFRQIFLTHLRQVKGRLAIAAVGTLGEIGRASCMRGWARVARRG